MLCISVYYHELLLLLTMLLLTTMMIEVTEVTPRLNKLIWLFGLICKL